MKNVTIKFTKNGKNYQMKNVPQGPKGVFSKVLGKTVRYFERRNNKGQRIKYPEVKVNGKWMYLHIYVLDINGVEVPKHYNRHHIDMDRCNNLLSNLAVVNKDQHLKLHHKYDVEHSEATEYEYIYALHTGGFKYINLDDDYETMWNNNSLYAGSLPAVVRKVRKAGLKVSKI